MLVKINQPGWELYNGPLLGVEFANGVSTDHVSRTAALALGAFIPVVEIEADGTEIGPISPTLDLLQGAGISAEVVVPMKTDAEVEAEKAQLVGETPEFAAEMDALAKSVKVYTEEELQAIASEKGINGLRPIGSELNVKNTSINGLIREILTAQAGR